MFDPGCHHGAAQPKEETGRGMNNQKILLIDYDPASISKTATPLTKAGYSVEVAKDGLSGLAAFERMKPALVLVEAMLPRKHGFEVCQEIKATPGVE